MPIKNRKQILSGLVSILVSVFLVATAVYAVTTIGENVSVGGNLTVNGTISEGGTALSNRYIAIPSGSSQGDILIRDDSGWTRLAAGTSGQYLKTQGASSNPVWASISEGVTTFLGLTDTPSSYSGEAGKYLKVNGTGDALEFGVVDLSGKANVSLDNLSGVAVNASLIPATDSAIDLGSSSKYWANSYLGNLKAATSVSAGINVETLAGDKTLNAGTDKMYQYLATGGANRIITLATTTANAGDKFIIRNNDGYSSFYSFQISQGGTTKDYIYSQSIREYIFNGTDWVSADVGTGIDSDYNVAVGHDARGYDYGAAVGTGARGYSFGAAVGHSAHGYNYGAAVGGGANGYDYGAAVGGGAYGYTYGAAVGYNAHGYTRGAAVGRNAKGLRYGAALGYEAGYYIDTSADRYNTLVGAYSGYQITTGIGNIILGYKSGEDATYSPTTGSKNILIGFQAGTLATTTSNFLNIGNLIFATDVNTATGTAISTGNVGIGTSTPAYKLQIAGDIVPTDNSLYSLGTSTLKWANIFAATTTVGDLVFGNNFRITEATSTEGLQTIVFKNHNGQDIMSLDENGNLIVPGSILSASSSGSGVGFSSSGIIGSLVDQIKSILSSLGLLIESGVASVQKLVASFIQTQDLEIGTSENPSGFTIYDKITKQPYCVTMESGEIVKIQGKCDTQTTTNSNTENSITTEQTTTDNQITTNETATSTDSTSTASSTETTTDQTSSTADTSPASDTNSAAAPTETTTDQTTTVTSPETTTDVAPSE